jgi:hypothetical protein
MGSNINIAVVQRHLHSVGHQMASESVADLLRQLGFSVNVEEENKEAVTNIKTSLIQRFLQKEEPLLPSRRVLSATTSTTATNRDRSNLSGSASIASLAAKLDALEAQLNKINSLQSNLHQKLDIDQERVPKVPQLQKMNAAPTCTEAQQLRDWAAEKWPNIGKLRTQRASTSSVKSWDSNSMSNRNQSNDDEQQQQQQPRGLQDGGGSDNTRVLKKRDPVARYQ